MKLLVAILIGKLISKLSKTLNIGGGSAAPGLYALKIEPKLVEKLVSKIPNNIIITGTNGKTTTSRMVAHLAKESGLKVIRNHTGSNLERGIASTLITHTRPGLMRLDYDLGIWELDEAAFNSLAPKIKPHIIVFLNVFRDQLDRYGEVDSVVNKWCQIIKTLSTDTVVLINGDDANTLKLASCFKGKVSSFGVENFKIVGESIEKQKSQVKLDFEAKNVKLNGLQGSSFKLFLNHKSYILNLPLPGIYHIYDALAALSTAFHLGLPIDRLTDTLTHFTPAFGRVEKLEFGQIFLIKNPAGATQVLETLSPNLKPQDKLLLALNDNLADGTDVSWIWDVNFERLQRAHTKSGEGDRLQIMTSGGRANELALRLKYAGFKPSNISVEPRLKIALRQAREGLKGSLYILPTYTAMLELQGILTRSGLKKHYWEDK